MKTLVKFLLVKNEQSLDSKYDYVEQIAKELKKDGLIVGDFIFAEQDDIYFLIEYTFLEKMKNKENGEIEEIETNWQIAFEFGTYPNSSQLKIKILSSNYLIDVNNRYLENLKVSIKNCIRREWDEIIWLEDKESEFLAVSLYPKIYSIENKTRQLINEVLSKEYYINWWDKVVPKLIKNKHEGRRKNFKSIVPAFINVDERLMSIDIKDLISIFTLQESTWNPQYDEEISNLLNEIKNISDSKIKGQNKEQIIKNYNENISKKMIDQLYVTNDLWSQIFSNYLSNDFLNNLNTFDLNRNHIAHNKLLDSAAYTNILRTINLLDNELDKALEKVSNIKSDEQIEVLEREYEYEIAQKEMIKDQMETEGGVNIRDEFEIIELYNEVLNKFFEDFEADLRFRDDIVITDFNEIPDEQYKGTLFTIKYKISDEEAIISYIVKDLSTSQGSDSSIVVRCEINGVEISSDIKYVNGEVEYNSDQGYYMPVTLDYIDLNDIEQLKEGLLDLVNNQFTSLREKLDAEIYSIKKDGGNDPVSWIPCWNCNESYICIDENYATFGQCLNCGEHHEIVYCDRCGTYFDRCFEGTN
ncbi:MAG: hypothetical protein ACK5K7_02345, partial [Bacilli bacterium]